MGRKVSGTFQYPLSKKAVHKIETLPFRQKLDNTGTHTCFSKLVVTSVSLLPLLRKRQRLGPLPSAEMPVWICAEAKVGSRVGTMCRFCFQHCQSRHHQCWIYDHPVSSLM